MRKKGSHPTLSEVAKRAGVGTTTVSRVINGGHLVDPKTLERVRGVIEAMNYTPNHAARILKGARTRTIGLVVPSIADPFFSSCAEAIQGIARANESMLIVTTTQNDPHTELENVRGLMRHRVEGLIIAPANSRNPILMELLQRMMVPVVAVDRPLLDAPIPAVVSRNFAGAQMATQHLIEHGYRRILCLTSETTLYTISERIRGYKHTMKSAGREILLDTSVKDYRSAEYVLESQLAGANPPDAIFTLKNSVTIHVFEVLQKLNIEIPGKVALLGYDDFELASTVRPSISVVQQPVEALGRTAAEILFERLNAAEDSAERVRQPSRDSHITELETHLVRRSSCGCSWLGR